MTAIFVPEIGHQLPYIVTNVPRDYQRFVVADGKKVLQRDVGTNPHLAVHLDEWRIELCINDLIKYEPVSP